MGNNQISAKLVFEFLSQPKTQNSVENKTRSDHIDSIIKLYAMAIPPFPIPHPELVEELKILCGENENEKGKWLYDYLGKLMVFEKQLKIFKEGMLGDDVKSRLESEDSGSNSLLPSDYIITLKKFSRSY